VGAGDRAVAVPVLVEGRDLSVAVERRGPDGQQLRCAGPGWSLAGLELGMAASYQPSNALLAVAAARELGAAEAAIRSGLARARWPGRFQILRRASGFLVLDGAHNPAGAGAVAASLRDVFGAAPVTFVLGILADKDAAGIVAALAPLAARIVLVAPASSRAAAPDALRALVPATVDAVEIAGSPAEALERAGPGAETPVICGAGALFPVGDRLRHLSRGAQPCSLEKEA